MVMVPTFTVLIGSAGRGTLRQTLDSVARQPRLPGDQCLVSFDAFERRPAEMDALSALVRSYGEGFVATRYDSGYHWLGVEQINHALRTVPLTGTHCFTLGDDDVFVDDAYHILRPVCAANPVQPVLYRFVAPWRELLWDVPRMHMSRISGCCIAAPTSCVGPMPTRQYVEHDYDWMVEILAKAPTAPLWLDDVLVIARPPEYDGVPVHRGVLQCWHCKAYRFLEMVEADDEQCPSCGVRLVRTRQAHPVTNWQEATA